MRLLHIIQAMLITIYLSAFIAGVVDAQIKTKAFRELDTTIPHHIDFMF